MSDCVLEALIEGFAVLIFFYFLVEIVSFRGCKIGHWQLPALEHSRTIKNVTKASFSSSLFMTDRLLKITVILKTLNKLLWNQ